jgi:acyl-CoA thioester hydrolase
MRVVEAPVRVRYAETDAQGVVYYANYFVWFEVGRITYLRAAGFDYAQMEREGFGFVIAEAYCRYLAPAHFNEELMVRTWIAEIKQRSFAFAYEVVNQATGQLLATGQTAQVVIDYQGKPREIPAVLRQMLEASLSG